MFLWIKYFLFFFLFWSWNRISIMIICNFVNFVCLDIFFFFVSGIFIQIQMIIFVLLLLGSKILILLMIEATTSCSFIFFRLNMIIFCYEFFSIISLIFLIFQLDFIILWILIWHHVILVLLGLLIKTSFIWLLLNLFIPIITFICFLLLSTIFMLTSNKITNQIIFLFFFFFVF